MDLGGRHYLSQYKIQTSAQKIEGQNKTLLNYKEKKNTFKMIVHILNQCFSLN